MSGPSERWNEALRRLGHDRRHGATELSLAAVDTIAAAAPSLSALSANAARARVRAWGRTLGATQPAMGAFTAAGEAVQAIARGAPSERLREELEAWSRTARRALVRELPAVVRTGRVLFPPHAEVVTLSRSETLLRLLSSLRGASAPQRVTVLRSRPGGEGATASRLLRAQGLRSRCVDDRRADEAVGEADLVLVGADSLFRDGSILHKVGTRPLAESAQRSHVPVVVAVGLSKLVPTRISARHTRWFDHTPSGMIQEYWTDRGRWTAREVEDEADRRLRPPVRRAATTTSGSIDRGRREEAPARRRRGRRGAAERWSLSQTG